MLPSSRFSPTNELTLTANIRCVTFQKSVDLIYTAAECCNHTEGVSVKTVKTEFRDHQNVTSKFKYTAMYQSNTTNFIMFIIVLGQHVSILIESSSGPSKIQILI